MNNKEKSDIARKFRVLNHVLKSGNVSKTCRYFEMKWGQACTIVFSTQHLISDVG